MDLHLTTQPKAEESSTDALSFPRVSEVRRNKCGFSTDNMQILEKAKFVVKYSIHREAEIIQLLKLK